jgi:outer membrane biosynthesis protein TonB
MRQNSGPAELPPQQDEVTVRLSGGGVHQAASAEGPPADGVTVLVPGAVLAPAPKPEGAGAGETPVFVDDSGNRKRLLRLAGVLIALVSIGFIALVGVALAVPNVATSVGLGDVMPFIVPGAAVQPPPTALPAPRVQAAQPKPKPKPVIGAIPTTAPEPVNVGPTATPAPVAQTTVEQASATAPPTTQAPVTQAPATQAPGGAQTGGTPAQGGQAPANANAPGPNTNP